METIKLTVTRAEVANMFALLEADEAPPCEVVVKKAEGGTRVIEIKTDPANTDYFANALRGGG